MPKRSDKVSKITDWVCSQEASFTYREVQEATGAAFDQAFYVCETLGAIGMLEKGSNPKGKGRPETTWLRVHEKVSA